MSTKKASVEWDRWKEGQRRWAKRIDGAWRGGRGVAEEMSSAHGELGVCVSYSTMVLKYEGC